MLTLLVAAVLGQADPPASPLQDMHTRVIEAIRNCAHPAPGEIVVCSKDRGFAEGYRLPKSDPRFEHRDSPIVNLLQGNDGPPPNACNSPSLVGKTGCSIDDYRKWQAWKRAQEARGQAN